MKNVAWVINGILALAVVVLFVLVLGGKTGENEGKGHDNQSESEFNQNDGDVKVGYVLIDSLLAYYKMAQDLSAELLQSQQGLESELTTKGQKLEKKIADYQYQVQRGLITSRDAQATEKQLAEEQQVFVNLQNDMQNRLMREEQEKNTQVYETVIDFVERYNKDKGFNLIISQTTGGVLLYAEKYMNVTAEVLAGLNAEYDASK